MPQGSQKLPRTPYESSRDKIISACDGLLKLVVADGLAGNNQIKENAISIKACFSDGSSQTEKHNKILQLTKSIEQQLRSELEKAENDNNSVKVTGLVTQKIAKIEEELNFIAIIETNIAGVLPLKREAQPNLEAEVPPILAAAATPITNPTNDALQELLEEAIKANEVLSTNVATTESKNLELSNENKALIAGLQQHISEQKLQTIPADDQKSKIEELTQANTVLAEQLTKSQAQHRSEIEAARNSATASIIKLEESKQELTAENVDLKTQLDGLTEKNAALQAKSNDQKEKVELLKIESNTHLENAMARFDEIKALKEQMSKMEEAAQQLATASSANMANMADRIGELEQREQRLAVENTILIQKSKLTTAAPLSFSKQRISGIAPRIPNELIEPEPLPSITLVRPASPILTTEPINPSITEKPTRPSILGDFEKNFTSVTPTVSGGAKVVNIQTFPQEGEEKKPDRPYFDRANTQAINLDETNQLQTLFDDGKLKFSDPDKPNKITFNKESMDSTDQQAMVAILQATSKDNKESTLNNVEVILTGKDEDLIQVLQQFHAKLEEAVQGNEDEKICAIKIQDTGHSEKLTDLIKLHNDAADIIHNKEALTPDKKNNILDAIHALQAQATKSPEPTSATHRHSSPS